MTLDKGLDTNYWGRGSYKTGGGHVKFYPYNKGGGEDGKSFSHAEGGVGGTKSFGVAFRRWLERFRHIEGGAQKVLG